MSRLRRWSIVEGKEPLFVSAGLVFSFIMLLTLVFFLSQSIIEKENTLMQFEAERGFSSSTLLLLQQEHTKAVAALEESNVKGIGVYSNTGRLMLGLGSIPNAIPLDKFNAIWRTRSADQWNRGIATYNKETGMIEYLRFSRLTIQVETGDFTLEEDGFLPSPMSFPDVLYILFDGEEYQRKVMLVRAFAITAVIGLLAFYLLVLNIYQSNRKYRVTLAKQENLVNLGEAARTLAHEIKNPLSAITLQVALLKKTLPKEKREDLAVVDHEVQRLIQLTNKVSDFLRNPVGTPERIDIYDIIEALQLTFATPVLFVPGCLRHAIIHFDSDRARSVFENLLKNATESCSDRDPQVEVEISEDKRRQYHIFVRDRGDGIPEENMEKIFDPFFTTKIHGSGIGLSICRQFVKARGGNLRLYPREGGGTVAEVILPKDTAKKGIL
jgi:two-component system, NtrC family, sensor histidine kinase HydH